MSVMLKSEFDKLQAKKVELKRKLNEIAKDIGEAAEKGDLSENSEFDDAKERRDRVIERIKELESKMSDVQLIEPEDLPPDTVCIGKIVKIRGFNVECDSEFIIVTYPLSTNEITTSSPLGRAIIGKRVGERTKLDLPGGAKDMEIVGLRIA